MSYNNSNTQNTQRNRNRKVIWFNPQFSQNVETNIGKLSFKLMRKHFPKNSKYHKIFNLNTSKLSYCRTANVGNIKQHNSKVLSKTNDNTNRKCNCKSTKLSIEWRVLHSMSSIQSYIYNIHQQLCLLWNF